MRIYTIKPLILAGLTFTFFAQVPVFPALAQNVNSKEEAVEKAQPSDPDPLLRQLQEAIDKCDLKQADSIARSLGQQGDKAVSSIQKELQSQNVLRGYLIFALGQISGDTSTDTLLSTAYRDRDAGNLTLGHLVGHPIPRRLTAQELDSWITRLQTSNVARAGSVARILSLSTFNDVQQRAEPIISRFIEEARSPQPTSEVHGAYLSQPAVSLNQFVIALAQFKDPIVVRLLQENIKSQTDPNVIKWLTISLGFMGDTSAASQLKLILTQEKDGSTKAAALRAYARAAQEEALPVLKTYLGDKTVTGQGHQGPYYGVQMAAQTELAWLQAQSKPASP